jgi:hypothetical protein
LFKKTTFRTVLRHSCSVFCKNLRIWSLRTSDSGMSPRIYEFGNFKKVWCPPLVFKQNETFKRRSKRVKQNWHRNHLPGEASHTTSTRVIHVKKTSEASRVPWWWCSVYTVYLCTAYCKYQASNTCRHFAKVSSAPDNHKSRHGCHTVVSLYILYVSICTAFGNRPKSVFQIRIRIDLALLDSDPHWQSGSGSRRHEIWRKKHLLTQIPNFFKNVFVLT